MDFERNCSTCAFAVRSQAVGENGQPIIGQSVLHCHWGPPSAMLVQVAPGAVSQSAMFPPVTAEMGCAQHEPADDSPPLKAV